MLRRAHGAAQGDLERWIKCLAALVKPRGSLTFIYKAESLPHLLACCRGRFGDLLAFPLFPREGAPASRVLLRGRKGSRAPFRLMPGMVLHGEGNGFTPQADAILRDGAGLDLGPRK
jgi:tRNA1(Val) A37 N6-methylase TrmN6